MILYRLDRYSLRSKYSAERRTRDFPGSIVLTYHSLDGCTYGSCRVRSVVLLDLLEEVAQIVVGDVFP